MLLQPSMRALRSSGSALAALSDSGRAVASSSGTTSSCASSSAKSLFSGPRCARCFSSSPTAQAKPRKERRSDDPFSLNQMPKFEFDDVPTLGHAILNRQRELLKYGRLVEWELPKLEALRRPYTPPSTDCILRFRSLHYQGEAHPVTRKSVVTFQISDLYASGVLTSAPARRKFLLLAGARWDPFGKDFNKASQEKQDFDIINDPHGVEQLALSSGLGSVKISSERFPEERQNLKWCSDVVDKMIEEANTNPEQVANVPLDLRAARTRELKRIALARKQAPTLADFPKEWLP